MQRPLSLCLILPEGPLCVWQAEAALSAAKRAGSVSVLRLDNAPPPGGAQSGDAVFSWYARLDRLFFKKQPDAFASGRIDIPGLPAVKYLNLAETATLEEARRALCGAELILSLSGAALPRTLLAQAPLGAIYFDHHDPRRGAHPQTAAAFMDGAPGFAHGLVWAREGLGARMAQQSYSAVMPLYLFDNANQACHKAARFPARFLDRLTRAASPEDLWNTCPEVGRTEPQQPPTALATLAFLPRFLARHAAAAYKDIFYRRQWFLAARPVQRSAEHTDDAWNFDGFAPIFPPREAGWADPFPFSRDGRDYVFFETIPMDTGRGAIACAPVDEAGNLGAPRTVLEREFHLSYPYLFEWEGEVYMMPESNAGRTLDIYRAVEFPGVWRLEKNIMSGVRVTDATMYEEEPDGRQSKRFWLFANMSAPGASNWDELHLFLSDAPFGPWQAHPKNPVVSDARSARPGGRLFRRNGRLYRPAQDCTPTYGRRLKIFEVLALTGEDYQERLATILEPELIPGSGKLHTLNTGRTVEFVDGFRLISRFTGKPGRFKDI